MTCRVIVLHAPRPAPWSAAHLAQMLEQMPYGKRLELEAVDAGACTASLAGLRLLDAVLARVAPEAGSMSAGSLLKRLRFPAGGKPLLPGGPSFSISHSSAQVACAVGVGTEVGLDIEECGPGRSEEWLAGWTAREACLKAAGLGLRAAAQVVLGAGYGRIGMQEFRLTRLALGAGRVAQLASVVRPECIEVLAADPAVLHA